MWSKPETPRAFRWRRRRPWQRRPSVCSRKLNRPSFVSRWSSPAQTSSTSTAFVHPRPATTTMSSIHAEPPPPIVTEPTGINYATGPSLGKGGFAICHRAERYDGSRPTGHIVALKIVKTKMEPAKLAQKVKDAIPIIITSSLLTQPSVCFRAPDPLETLTSKHCHILPRILLQHQHICRPGHVPEWIIGRHAEEAKMLDPPRDQTIHDPDMWRCKIPAYTTCRASRFEDWQPLPGCEYERASRRLWSGRSPGY